MNCSFKELGPRGNDEYMTTLKHLGSMYQHPIVYKYNPGNADVAAIVLNEWASISLVSFVLAGRSKAILQLNRNFIKLSKPK